MAVILMDEFRLYWGNGGTATIEVTQGTGLTCYVLGP